MSNILDNPYGLEIDSDFHFIRRSVTIALLKEYLDCSIQQQILDVGCGKGEISRIIKSTFPLAKIDAIDISVYAIEYSINTVPDINFFVGNATCFPFKSSYYDAIVCNNIYEHIENPISLLKNLQRSLKEEGVIIISTPNRYHIKNLFRCILGFPIVIPKYHVTEYSIGQLYDHHVYCHLMIEKILLPSYKFENFKLSNFILVQLIQPILNQYLKLIGSRNRLGGLLFVISKKKRKFTHSN